MSKTRRKAEGSGSNLSSWLSVLWCWRRKLVPSSFINEFCFEHEFNERPCITDQQVVRPDGGSQSPILHFNNYSFTLHFLSGSPIFQPHRHQGVLLGSLQFTRISLDLLISKALWKSVKQLSVCPLVCHIQFFETGKRFITKFGESSLSFWLKC